MLLLQNVMHVTIDVCGYLLVNNRYGQSFLEILSNTKLAKYFQVIIIM